MFEEKLITIAENIDKVYKAGQGAESGGGGGGDTGPDFWDIYQDYGNLTNYNRAFMGQRWNNTTFCPKYSIYPIYVGYMFSLNEITDLPTVLEAQGVELDFSRVTSNNNAARPFDGSRIQRIGVVNLSNATGTFNTFFGTSNASTHLKTIDKLIVPENLGYGNNFFQNQNGLTNITIEGTIGKNFPIGACPLSAESVQSIIDHLKDLTGATAQTLTVSAHVYNNVMTDAQKQAISAKNWNLAQA